jgi:hypothetical protein
MPWSSRLMLRLHSLNAVAGAGESGAGTMPMGGGGSNYNADPAGAILDNDGCHPLGPPWHI